MLCSRSREVLLALNRGLLLAAIIGNSLVVGLSFTVFGWNAEGPGVATRSTARFAIAFFLVGLAAPGLKKWIHWFPDPFGLIQAFVAAQMIHFACVILLHTLFGPERFHLSPGEIVITLVGFSLVMAAGATAVPRPGRRRQEERIDNDQGNREPDALRLPVMKSFPNARMPPIQKSWAEISVTKPVEKTRKYNGSGPSCQLGMMKKPQKNNPQENDHRQPLVSSDKSNHFCCHREDSTLRQQCWGVSSQDLLSPRYCIQAELRFSALIRPMGLPFWGAALVYAFCSH